MLIRSVVRAIAWRSHPCQNYILRVVVLTGGRLPGGLTWSKTTRKIQPWQGWDPQAMALTTLRINISVSLAKYRGRLYLM